VPSQVADSRRVACGTAVSWAPLDVRRLFCGALLKVLSEESCNTFLGGLQIRWLRCLRCCPGVTMKPSVDHLIGPRGEHVDGLQRSGFRV
jgi:hypothetical protein